MLEEDLRKELIKLESEGLGRKLPRQDYGLRNYVDFTSNDYLALRNDQRVLEAMRSAEHVGEGASRLVSRTSSEHILLEQELAKFVGFERAMVFGAGYLANLGVISALVRRHDIIISDRAIHASLIDGIRLSGAKNLRFLHNNILHLEELLKRESATADSRRFFVVVESVYSMDGDIAPLREIVELKSKYNFELIVDEAHAFGVFGAGLVNRLGLQSNVTAVTATLSKAFGSYGGVVCSSSTVCDYLIATCRPFIFNTALPLPLVKAAKASLGLIRDNPKMGEELLGRAKKFAERLTRIIDRPVAGDSQIVPLVIGGNEKVLLLARELEVREVFVHPMRSPTVRAGEERLRFSLTLNNSVLDIERSLQIIAEVFKNCQ